MVNVTFDSSYLLGGQLILFLLPNQQNVPDDGYIWQDAEVSRRAALGGKVFNLFVA